MLADLEKERQVVADLQYQLEERNSELEAIRKRLNRDLPLNGVSENGKMPSSPSKHDLATAKEEIKGLKYVHNSYFLPLHSRWHLATYRRHIIQELQKENSAILQRHKLLEAENKLLSTEIDQLRDVRPEHSF